MKEDDIRELANSGFFRGNRLRGQVEKTHISWVILSRKFAFKIKKPVRLTFLDFSTQARRKRFCEHELRLNQRYSKIYLEVLPVRNHKGTWHIGAGEGRVLDYAVQMKRMVSTSRMDKMLKEGTVTRENIHALALSIAEFHKKSKIIKSPFDVKQAEDLFNDILSEEKFIETRLGKKYASMVRKSVAWSDAFLKSHQARMRERIELGFKRDVHGDLHSGNIFLYKKPILFDCIEFSDAFRRIDVIHEIAFFCMDLEAFGKRRLANLFLKQYNTLFPCIFNKEDKRLLTYYKCCRANVRAKVHAASAQSGTDVARHLNAVRGYLDLMDDYIKGNR